MGRDREKTMKRIFDALAGVLAEEGFEKTGVNAVAQRAGVDKVLIYRYFGGMPGLLAAFAEREEFWPAIESFLPGQPNGENSSPDEAAKAVLVGYARALRNRPVTREILRWELIERNELTDALAGYREQQGLQFLEQYDHHPDLDLPALASLLYAGIVYLSLRSKTAGVFNGIDITSDQGWERIEKAISVLVDAVLEDRDNH